MVLETDPADFKRRGNVGTTDPKNQSILIFLTHNMVGLDQMAKGIGLGVGAAIDEFSVAAI